MGQGLQPVQERGPSLWSIGHKAAPGVQGRWQSQSQAGVAGETMMLSQHCHESTAQPESRAHGLAHAAALSCSEDEGREFGPGLQMRQQGQWGSCLTLLSTESSRSQKEAVALP